MARPYGFDSLRCGQYTALHAQICGCSSTVEHMASNHTTPDHPRSSAPMCEAQIAHDNLQGRERRTQRTRAKIAHCKLLITDNVPTAGYMNETDATRCAGGSSEKFRVESLGKITSSGRDGDTNGVWVRGTSGISRGAQVPK